MECEKRRAWEKTIEKKKKQMADTRQRAADNAAKKADKEHFRKLVKEAS